MDASARNNRLLCSSRPWNVLRRSYDVGARRFTNSNFSRLNDSLNERQSSICDKCLDTRVAFVHRAHPARVGSRSASAAASMKDPPLSCSPARLYRR